MKLEFLLRGLIIGFSIAAPVGPIGVLCIRRTLSRGRVSGLVTGLGAATADAMYGAVAGFGLTVISGFLVSQQTLLRLVGGAFLCYLGLRTFLSKPAAEPAKAGGAGLAGDYGSTFVLTLTNPATILSFVAVFAGLGLGASDPNNYLAATSLVLGVFAGSAFWWLILSGGVGFFREKFDAKKLRWVNVLSGLILIAFGLIALLIRNR